LKIKQTNNNQVRHLLALLQNANQNSCNVVIVKKEKFQYKPLLKILQNNGIIQSFEEKKAFLFVRLKKTY
jgi:ribosomal protein S8